MASTYQLIGQMTDHQFNAAISKCWSDLLSHLITFFLTYVTNKDSEPK